MRDNKEYEVEEKDAKRVGGEGGCGGGSVGEGKGGEWETGVTFHRGHKPILVSNKIYQAFDQNLVNQDTIMISSNIANNGMK